ncbi:hypothetical protein [Burkholderia stabilis]|uniref:hypothetical protein n=1 Tax=Burkholderia stabilis TaxID=95485 RepID=UPI0012EA3491|nr:hypothetical protein [Burkholderia stabilis]HDR9491888.1 hypothetical protein [Burkholderia stabilis]HDR9524166.1 hypothetical protein [Burkholderia stabilis]HDR9531036.1 hypothetical protein [Burkholderia stabilis]HDR9538576.1 hypothetical protein [Burkholderia stabilis]HDR9547665.1 hypothetical protein [Burkholderia stabilis]
MKSSLSRTIPQKNVTAIVTEIIAMQAPLLARAARSITVDGCAMHMMRTSEPTIAARAASAAPPTHPDNNFFGDGLE